MQAAPSPAAPSCSYCGNHLGTWPPSGPVEPCRVCRRPTVFVPIPGSRPRRLLMLGLLDAGASLYGNATVCLVVAFAIAPTSGREFVKACTLMLFVIGSVLAVDGILAVRTGIDRTWSTRRTGRSARALGVAKVFAATAALMLVMIGILL